MWKKIFKSDSERLGSVLAVDICRVRCAMANFKKVRNTLIEIIRSKIRAGSLLLRFRS